MSRMIDQLNRIVEDGKQILADAERIGDPEIIAHAKEARRLDRLAATRVRQQLG